MRIESIDIVGFKSFADRTTLKFGKGLTAVVGPNGSGKSNVSDAVRWVLGEQSTKSLRGTSMEDVIFSGTAKRKAHGYCEVTIHFDNADRGLNFNEDKVSVTRRYYRSHESEYAINGVSVRLRDVHELFMDTGLGRDGYSMIGQGKIDNIVSTKSNERRDIFEEASGISRYRYRKIDAERKLLAADENLIRLHDILDELKGRVGPLKEQSEKAEKFLVLAEEKKQLEIGLWLYMLEASKEAFRKQESKIAIATEQYRQIEEQLTDFDATMEKNSAELVSVTMAVDELKAEISSLEEQIARTEGYINVAKANIEHNNENIARLESEKSGLLKSDEDAVTEAKNKEQEIETLIQNGKDIEAKAAEVSEKLSSLIQSSENISRSLESKAMELNELSIKLSDYRVTEVTSRSSIAEISSRTQTITAAAEERKGEIEALEKEMGELNKDLSHANDIITSTENTIKGYEMRLANRKQAVDDKKAEMDNLSLDIAEKRRRAGILEDLQKNMEGYQLSVKACVAEAEKGLLSGIHGPVLDLIKVPKEYSVAIEIALGAAAQNIVVDSDSDAKKAIRFLKSENKGRATFLPLTSIKGREFTEKGLDDQYGYVGMASDLIEFDSKYSDIISSLLGRTVIVDDIDAAATIAKKYGYRFKVVSLDGQVVNQGGSLTGGSLGKHSGLLSRAGDIENLKNQAKNKEKKLAVLKEEFAAAESAYAAAEAEVMAVRSEAVTATEDKIRVEGEIRRVSQLLAAAKINLAELEKESDEAKVRTAELLKSAEQAAEQITILEKAEADIKHQMDEMNGGRDETADEREALSNELTELRLTLAANEKDIESAKTAVELLKKAISGRGEQSVQIENELLEAISKGKTYEEEILKLEAAIADAKNQVSNKQGEVEVQLQKRHSIEASSTTLRQSEKDKTLERERVNGELERLKAKKEAMTEELDDIVRRLYDEYELTRTEAECMGIEIENPAEAKRNLAETKSKIKALGNVNVGAIEEYKEVSERYEFQSAQVADVENTRAELLKLIGDLTEQMKTMFLEGFERIGTNFTRIFTEMFGGGHAELKLSDPEDPLNSGIDIVAKLPGKNVPSLDVLSGGEKALIAISIYFAIMQVNAPPFCFLDEVETALDDINVDRFANYMKRSDLDTQFICITHRRGTMEAADMLYGVTMQERGVTKLIQLDVAQLEMDLKSLEK
ncbi:MAG: chromosome segregation protein SMC [Clostridia bacterium]|nr:chromosome segregation protein SMC [Clostridia bacterium]